MAKTTTEICCALENASLQIGEKGFYTIATRLLCEIAANVGGGGAAGDDTEILCLCDDQGGGVVVPFLRIITVDSGGVITTADFELDASTVYVPLGTVGKCATGSPDDDEIMLLCDNQGGDPVVLVRFLRRYTVTGGVVTITDTELDGTTAYVVVGTAEVCPEALGLSVLSDEVCVENIPNELWQLYLGATDGWRPIDGISQVCAGTFTAGIFSANLSGMVSSVDGLKMYALVGAAAGFPTSFEIVDIATATVDSTVALTGDAIPGRVGSLFMHPTTKELWIVFRNVAGSLIGLAKVTTGGVVSEDFEAFLDIPASLSSNEVGGDYDKDGNFIISHQAELVNRNILRLISGSSQMTRKIIADDPSTGYGEVVYLPNGNINTFEGTRFYTQDGGHVYDCLVAYGEIQAAAVVRTFDPALSIGVKLRRDTVVDENGNTIDIRYYLLATGEEVTIPSLFVLGECPTEPACCDKEIVEVGTEILSVTAAGTSTLTPPVGAKGAIMQVQVLTGGAKAVRYRTDGVAPTAAIGIRAFDLAYVSIGVVPDVFRGDPEQLSRFETIGEAGVTADLFVTYFGVR